MAKISVIVPVYNVEDYLSCCLDSVLSQTFFDIEVICVNDGSEDNSRNILETYQKQDNRIKIIDKQNGGLSSARNTGMKAATGEFICFVDSDDWIEHDMLEQLYDNITGNSTDIVMCGVKLFDESTQEYIKEDSYFNLSVFDKKFDNKVFSYEDTKSFLMEVPVMAWNKLYRRSFLIDCKAEFPNGKIFEDGPFFFSIYFKTKCISIVRKLLYNYRINREGSIIKQGGEKFFDIIDVVNLMFNEIQKTTIFDEVKYDFYKHKADDIIYRYELISLKLKPKFSKKFKNESCLLDERYFDFAKINKEHPITYKSICIIKAKTNILSFYWQKFIIRLMYKVMQVLYTEEGVYYFKFWSLKFRIKKRNKILDIWYENDWIYIVIFYRIKFKIKFEYTKLRKK